MKERSDFWETTGTPIEHLPREIADDDEQKSGLHQSRSPPEAEQVNGNWME
jgi:hypothetical protein